MCITIAANIAETAILTYPACFPDSVIGFIADDSKCDVSFVEYTFRNLKKSIQQEATGSVQDNINLQTLERLKFLLPPLAEQKAIAHILGTLDDKIEVNRRMNETLEGMARALFKSWFVDFDPVIDNALAAGDPIPEAFRDRAAQRAEAATSAASQGRPFGLPKPLAAQFPNAFHDSDLGPIPEGWELSSIGQHFRLTMGQSPPGSTYNERGEGLPFYQGRSDFGFRFPTRRVYCTSPKRLAQLNDTLVSVRAPVGDVNMARERCVIGRGVAAIRHNSGSRSFTYYSIHHLREYFDRFEAEGTVFGSINKNDFQGLPFIAPTADIASNFDRFAGPLDDRIQTCARQSTALTVLRDTLLPKLLSGELRVRDAEKFVEAAV